MFQMPQRSVSEDSYTLFPVLLEPSPAAPPRMLHLPLPRSSHQLNAAPNHPPAPWGVTQGIRTVCKVVREAQINTRLWCTNGSFTFQSRHWRWVGRPFSSDGWTQEIQRKLKRILSSCLTCQS